MGIFPRIWYDMAYDMGILSYYGYYHHIRGYQSWCGYDMEIVAQYRKNWHYLAFHQDGSVMDSHGDIWTIWRLLGFSGDQPFWVAPLGALQIWESKPGMVNSKIAGSSGCSPANVFLTGIDPSASVDFCRASCNVYSSMRKTYQLSILFPTVFPINQVHIQRLLQAIPLLENP